MEKIKISVQKYNSITDITEFQNARFQEFPEFHITGILNLLNSRF